MKGLSSNNTLDQQYLKAMGIDMWVGRDHQAEAGAPVVPGAPNDNVAGATSEKSASEKSTAANVSASLANCSLPQLITLLPELNVVVGRSELHANLLVLTDSPAPSGQSDDLLGSMFTAIKLATEHWMPATITADSAADTLQTVMQVAQPQAIVVMLRAGKNFKALDKLRGQQIQMPAINAFAIVTFHPQDLIDSPDLKRPAWEDLKLLRQWMG